MPLFFCNTFVTLLLIQFTIDEVGLNKEKYIVML